MINQDYKFNKKAFSKNLKRLMDKNHISSNWLAKKLNLSKGAISNYLHGTSAPRTDTASEISQIFGVNINELFQENFIPKTLRHSQIKIKNNNTPESSNFLREDGMNEISYYLVPIFLNELRPSDIIYITDNYGDRILSTLSFCEKYECYGVLIRDNLLSKSGFTEKTTAIYAAMKETENGDFAAVLYKDEHTIRIRKIEYKEDKIILSTDKTKEEYKTNSRNCPVAVLG